MIIKPLPLFVVESFLDECIIDGKSWALISISENESFPTIPEHKDCKGVLQLTFHDIDFLRDDEPLILFDDDHAKVILEFIEPLIADKLDTLLVHCFAGLSRSPAVAAAI